MSNKILVAYALKDKQAVTTYIITPLTQEGLEVWDYTEDILLGDSMIQSISTAMGEADYGILIVSPHLLGEHWSREMFRALLSLDSLSNKRLLPVWYQLDYEVIARDFPLLKDRKPALASDGWQEVFRHIMKVVAQRTPTPEIVDSLPAKPEAPTRSGDRYQAGRDIKIIKSDNIEGGIQM
ncbi:MAG: toll/interleukin-1 receptor domain-containing protein [Bacteroidota bacterium]